MKKYLLILVLFLAVNVGLIGQELSDKAAVQKADFIFDLISNTEWPDESAAGNDTFVISVIDQPTFVEKLKETAAENSKLKINIEIQSISIKDDFSGSNLVYMGNGELSDLAKVLKKTEKRPILTVTDIEGYARYGVIVELVTGNDGKGKVEYVINKMVMRKSGLKISDELIKKAKKTFGQ